MQLEYNARGEFRNGTSCTCICAALVCVFKSGTEAV
jgi:hypothetical protein